VIPNHRVKLLTHIISLPTAFFFILLGNDVLDENQSVGSTNVLSLLSLINNPAPECVPRNQSPFPTPLILWGCSQAFLLNTRACP